jgi:hypothetical protein
MMRRTYSSFPQQKWDINVDQEELQAKTSKYLLNYGTKFNKDVICGSRGPEKRWSREAAWSASVCTISGFPWPSRQDICPDVNIQVPPQLWHQVQ